MQTPRMEAWAAQVSTLRIVTAFGQTPLRKAEVVAAACKPTRPELFLACFPELFNLPF